MILHLGITLVNVGQNNSIIAETRKKNNNISVACTCHMAHNIKSTETKSFVKAPNNSNVEALLADISFFFLLSLFLFSFFEQIIYKKINN